MTVVDKEKKKYVMDKEVKRKEGSRDTGLDRKRSRSGEPRSKTAARPLMTMPGSSGDIIPSASTSHSYSYSYASTET